MSGYQLSPAETIGITSGMLFSPASDKLLFCEARARSPQNANKRSSIVWSLGSWTIANGIRNIMLTGTLPGKDPQVSFSPDGEVVLICARQDAQFVTWALEIARLTTLRGAYDDGNRLWDEGRHRDALSKFSVVVADEMSAIVCPDMIQVWSRCIDVFSESGEEAKGRAVIQHLQLNGLKPSPETPQGRKVLDLFLAKQTMDRQDSDAKTRIAEERRIAEIRAKNRLLRISAANASKQEFVRSLLAAGRNGWVFDDFSFDDVFGPPDGDVQWTGAKRLYLYRCRDGVVQLKVLRSGATVFIEGVSYL